MKPVKLVVHQKSFNEECLVFNPKEFPDFHVGQILEIYSPESDFSRLLLQVTKEGKQEDFQQKEAISIEESIAKTFQLRPYAEISINIVELKDVVLDSVEITFKDQYLARSDMWRMKTSLVNTCVFLNKKIEFAGIRCQVYEMWAQGERVACGSITEDTKLVFRSASSMVYLFIQMSTEMWDFDINGDLYFEKAVNGFLSDLFAKWKKLTCNHDVTIVMFSRTFYEATSIEEFPMHARECLQKDYKGRFYEDFYRVVVQNERYEDWSSTLILLKRMFNEYQKLTLEHHKRPDCKLPHAFNSSSSQGNFLEVLNMSLNVFEKHYLDRSFDRTGQLSVVISPGVGVFDVDRELTNITKQRIIDNGIGSDLVCLGEQPLHAVPLFKFHNKFQNISPLNDADDYNMPHWINLSFYSSTIHISYSNFVPRIKLPTPLPKAERMKLEAGIKAEKRSRHISQPYNQSLPVVFNYNDYDAQIFKLPAHSSQGKSLTNSLQRPENRRKMTVAGIQTRTKSATVVVQNVSRLRKSSIEEIHASGSSFHVRSEPTLPSSSSSPSSTICPPNFYRSDRDSRISLARSPAISIPTKSSISVSSSGSQRRPVVPIKEAYPDSNSSQASRSNQSVTRSDSRINIPQRAKTDDDKSDSYEETRMSGSVSARPIVGSAPTSYEHPMMPKQMTNPRRPRALVNPFDPSHVTIKLTSNRRRWTHVFPLGPTGIFMQQHHYQAVPQNTAATILPVSLDGTVHDSLNSTLAVSLNKLQRQASEIQPIGPQNSTPDAKASSSRFHVEKVVEVDKKSTSTPLSRSLGGIHTSPSSASLATSDVASIRSTQPRATSSLPSGDPQTDKSLTWLWGATGEQEWTPALTTGVDWKSLAIPACLPITTDYFPDKRSLQSFYGISVYTLLPEDIGIDLAQLSRCFREDDMRHQLPPATAQVYWELIYQRLQQSFQVILLDKQHPDYPHTTSMVATQIKTSGTIDGQPQEEHLMSIGRIFHKISLDGSSITVTQYRPRHPFPTINIHYCYRFRAPDNDTYGVSWVDFMAEKIENYKWNSLDHYICQRGLGEYQLEDGMKFWRVRLLLLPGGHPGTQKILAGNNYCDVYDDAPGLIADYDEKLLHQKEGFLKFMELINKIRRPTRKNKVQLTKNLSIRRFSLGVNYTQAFGSLQNQLNNAASNVPFRERVGSTGTRMKTGTKALERVRSELLTSSGRVSPASELSSSTNSVDATMEELDELSQQIPLNPIVSMEVRKLSLLSTFSEIIDALKNPSEGITFVRQTGLPSMTFISCEAIAWIRDHVDGVDTIVQAISLLQKMEDEGFICHASGCKLPIYNGFYLYCFVSSNKDSEQFLSEDRDDYEEEMEMFQKEWMEVEIPPTLDPSAKIGAKKVLISDWEAELEKRQFEAKEINKTLYLKKVNLDLHFPGRQQPGDRVEWGHARYHSHYTPDTAYEIVLEWMVATGNVIAEVIMGWARKATGMNLHLVPIPNNPFALPFSSKSDPLRGPIFIPLILNELPEAASEMLQDEGLSIFQERILKRFGFLMHQECIHPKERQKQFVHTSGSIFIVSLPNPPFSRCEERVIKSFSNKKHDTLTESLPLGSPHEEYITRHFSGLKKSEIMTSNPETRVGFLLSWNYLITKRFKTNATGDENFMRKILFDMSEFCANTDDRLRNFWDLQLANSLAVEESDMYLKLEI